MEVMNLGRKCINETYAVCTKDTRIMIAIFDDGSIEKEFEDYLINEQEHIIERINHCNRDKNNNRYTTRKIIHFSEYGWKEWNEEYERYIKNRFYQKG